VKVQVLQENLQKGLSIVGRAVATRSTLPITSNVKIETEGTGRLKLSATDMDIGISAWVGARVDDPGATTVPSRLISDYVSSLPQAPVHIEIPERGRQVHLDCGSPGMARNDSTINAMDAEDFPDIPKVADGVVVTLDPRSLKQAIDRVEFASASDETRPVLTGVHLKSNDNRLTLAAADGFRLAVSDIALEQAPSAAIEVIVPARALRELGRLISDTNEPVEMRINGGRTHVLFAMRDIELVAGLIQGTFPNYSQLIPPEWNTRVTVKVDEFKREAKIASIFARDGSGIIRLQMEGDALKVSAAADEVGNNEGVIEARVEGDGSKIAFNSRYLQDVLNALDGDVKLEMTSPSSQGVFRPVGDDAYVHVVMPMFVQW
jgi:DNA polymerase-3 subunit beta